MPQGKRHLSKQGQAMAELVIALVTIVILIVGTTTLTRLAVTHVFLRRDVRAIAGQQGIKRSTSGHVQPENSDQGNQTQFVTAASRINEYTRLNAYAPALQSRLPASNYTLHARSLPTQELGLREVKKTAIIPLDKTFTTLIYTRQLHAVDENGNVGIRLEEKISYPATSGLWPDRN